MTQLAAARERFYVLLMYRYCSCKLMWEPGDGGLFAPVALAYSAVMLLLLLLLMLLLQA